MVKMKGTDTETMVLVFIILIILAISIYHIRLSLIGQQGTETFVVSKDSYTIQNALELAYSYLETSADYSIYQTFYDMEIINGLSKDEIENKFKTGILDNMNKYTGKKLTFLKKEIELPDYNEIIFIDEGSKTRIQFKPENNLVYIAKYLEGKKNVILTRNANIEKVFLNPIYMMSSAQNFLDDNTIVNCNKGDIMGSAVCGPYMCTASIQGNDGGQCEAIINVKKQDEKYPIYDSINKEIIFEYVSLSFRLKKELTI